MANRQTAGTRAKDSDRNDTCQILDSALSDGQLSMEEHRTRVALATQSETLGDLQSLISDLQTANAPVQLPDLKRRPKMPTASGGADAIFVMGYDYRSSGSSPVGSIVAHVSQHVAAVTHAYESEIFNPPVTKS